MTLITKEKLLKPTVTKYKRKEVKTNSLQATLIYGNGNYKLTLKPLISPMITYNHIDVVLKNEAFIEVCELVTNNKMLSKRTKRFSEGVVKVQILECLPLFLRIFELKDLIKIFTFLDNYRDKEEK